MGWWVWWVDIYSQPVFSLHSHHTHYRSRHGVLAYANKDEYNGSWLNDRRHGQGVFTCAQDGKPVNEWAVQ